MAIFTFPYVTHHISKSSNLLKHAFCVLEVFFVQLAQVISLVVIGSPSRRMAMISVAKKFNNNALAIICNVVAIHTLHGSFWQGVFVTNDRFGKKVVVDMLNINTYAEMTL